MTLPTPPIPLVDLKRGYSRVRDDVQHEFGAILESMHLFLGPNVKTFEQDFANYLGVGHCIGVSDGTAALHLALRALGVGPGDEVITVSHTFFASVEAILLAGATPVFVDVDPESFTMDVAAAERAITAKTRVIMPVHLYGLMADMAGVMQVARRNGLRVVEDASQAHGARRDGSMAGAVGDFGTFSFYYSKNLGAYGEAGGVVTDDPELADRLAMLRDHGSRTRYYHDEVGLNGRIDELQAAVLRYKLPRLDAGNELRRRHARRYSELLAGTPVKTPKLFGQDHVFHLYVIRTPFRDALQAYLKEQGIGTGIHYPVPCHRQAACAKLGETRTTLPITDEAAGEILSLPMFPELRDHEIERVAAAVSCFFTRRVAAGADAAI